MEIEDATLSGLKHPRGDCLLRVFFVEIEDATLGGLKRDPIAVPWQFVAVEIEDATLGGLKQEQARELDHLYLCGNRRRDS